MALVDVDSWLTEYEACERLNQTLTSQLELREKRQRLSTEYNRISSSIQVGLKQFDTELRQLKIKLDSSAKHKTITFEEIERRQRQVDTLQSQLQQLQGKFNNVTHTDRAALLDESSVLGNSSWPTTSSDQGIGDNGVADFQPRTVESFKQRQVDLMEQQNRGLDTLSQTISRQRALASQLGREVEDQNEILDNLTNTMERVDASVHSETRNISQVNRRDSTWGYWLVIVLLFIAIIVVLFL